MTGRFSDTYTLKAEVDVGDLDQVADRLRDMAQATGEVGDASDQIADEVRAASENLFDMEDAAEGAALGARRVGEEAEQAGGRFGVMDRLAGGALKTLLGFAAIAATAGAALGGAVSDAMAWDDAMDKARATTILGEEALDEFQAAAQDLWRQGWGESIQEVVDGMIRVQQVTGEQDATVIEQITKDALIFSEAFDRDFNEALRAADALSSELGVDASQAFDMMTRAMQTTGDPAGDMLRTISEMAPIFAEMGFTGEEMMFALTNSLDGGAYKAGVMGQAIRDFYAGLQEGSADLALWQLGLDGMNVQFKRGQISAAEMLDAVVMRLSEMEDPIRRNRIGVELFGTRWKKLGAEAFLSLNKASAAFDDVEGATERAGAALQDGFVPAFGRMMRTIRLGMANAVTPFLEQLDATLIPLFDKAAVWINEKVIPGFVGFAGQAAAGAQQVWGFVESLAGMDAVQAAISAVSGFMGDLVGYLSDLNSTELWLIAGALAVMAAPAVIGAVAAGLSTIAGIIMGGVSVASPLLLVLGLIAAYESNFGGLRDAINQVRDALETGNVAGLIEGVANALLAIPKSIAEEIGDLVGIDVAGGLAAWGPVIDAAGLAFGTLKDAATDGLAAMGGAFSRARNTVESKLNDVITFVSELPGKISGGLSALGDTVEGALAPLKGAFNRAKNSVEARIDDVIGFVTNLPNQVTMALAGLDGVLGTNLSGVFQSARDLIKGLFDNPVEGLKGILYSLITNIIPSALAGLDGTLGTNLSGVFEAAVNTIAALFGEGAGLAQTLLALPEALMNWLSDLETKLRAALLQPFLNVLDELKNKVLDTPIIGDVIKAGGSVVEFVGGISPFAEGGAALAGRPVLVGEAGPELMIPGRNTGIVSNYDLRRALSGPSWQAHTGGGAGEVTVMDFGGAEFHFHGVQNAAQLLDELEKVKARRAYTRRGATAV